MLPSWIRSWERHTAVVEAACDRHDQPEVRLDEGVLCRAQRHRARPHAVDVVLEGTAAPPRRADLHRQPLAMPGVERLEVGEDPVGHDAVRVDAADGQRHRLAIRLVSVAVGPGLTIPQRAGRLRQRRERCILEVVGVELAADEADDPVDERRVGKNPAPLLGAQVGDLNGGGELLLRAHHVQAGHLAEVHAQRGLVVVLALLRLLRARAGLLVRRGTRGPLPPAGASKSWRRSASYLSACHCSASEELELLGEGAAETNTVAAEFWFPLPLFMQVEHRILVVNR